LVLRGSDFILIYPFLKVVYMQLVAIDCVLVRDFF